MMAWKENDKEIINLIFVKEFQQIYLENWEKNSENFSKGLCFFFKKIKEK